MKRLSIPLNEEQHKMIKVAAMLNGQTMKSYILDKLFITKSIPNDKTLRAMQDIEENKHLTTFVAEDFLNQLKKINEQVNS